MFDHDYNSYPELTNTELQTLRYTSPFKQIEADFYATVVKVTDGDTVRLRAGFRDFDFPLRFLDINAPEMNEEGGKEAKEWLTGQILNKEVLIKIDPNNRVDKYGRLLGRIFYNGLDMGEQEIYLGLAKKFLQRNEGKLFNLYKYFSVEQWV